MADSKIIYLAGGCFWGLEEYMSRIQGVLGTTVGYANSIKEKPSYEEVCAGSTKAAEAAKIVYDPEELSLSKLLKAFFQVIDPTSMNKQGGDAGTQYRTGIYYVDHEDITVISESMDQIQKNYKKPIVTEVMPLVNFHPAEEYHQNYLKKNPKGYCHINVDKAEEFNK